VTVMQSLGCHTVKAEIQPNDRDANGGTSNQRAGVYSTDSLLAKFGGGQPSLEAKEGTTIWYGFAFTTNAAYRPHYDPAFGSWNTIWAFHDSSFGGSYSPLAPLNLEVATVGYPSGTRLCQNTGLVTLSPPRLQMQLNGGNKNTTNWPNDDTDNTCRRFLGPSFTSGTLYRVQIRVTWGAHKNGALQVWTNGVKWVDQTGVDTMWESGGTADPSMYPVFENYRYYDTSLPTDIMYYGGLIKGATQADVAVP
jgi:Polysaccharide lyase